MYPSSSSWSLNSESVAGPSEALRGRAEQVWQVLGRTYPDARCELDFDNPLQLLVATVLSAQSTDKRVNLVTPELFARFGDARALASADIAQIEAIIRPTGFFRNKAKALVGIGQGLVEHHDGQVPADFDALVALPGVGAKTANVVLGNAFGVPGLTPDTHFMRVSRRLGWTHQSIPAKIEADVAKLFAPDRWVLLSHRLIWHGRRCCHARRPACGVCPVAALCDGYGAGPTDPAVAATLIREPRR